MLRNHTLIAEEVVRKLNAAGNAGDATAYAKCFSEDADFVNRFGAYFSGRQAIEERHRIIFRSFHAGTTGELKLVKSRALAGGEILAIVSGLWRVPAGPLAGDLPSTYTLLIANVNEGWNIVAFQNTSVTASPK